jgi:hypothetical protein
MACFDEALRFFMHPRLVPETMAGPALQYQLKGPDATNILTDGRLDISIINLMMK